MRFAVCDIDHPNVVRVIDADVHEGVPYYAMEYVPGLDCAALVGQIGALATGDACEIARQTACALDWVHAHGVVHRDVNPSNLLLGIDGDVRLLDFGLAIRWPGPLPDASLDGRHPVPGTPDFVAPEVILNPSAVDPLSDVYVVGCTLYYLLSGESPFPCRAKNGADAKMAAHAMTPFPSIQATRNKVPLRISEPPSAYGCQVAARTSYGRRDARWRWRNGRFHATAVGLPFTRSTICDGPKEEVERFVRLAEPTPRQVLDILAFGWKRSSGFAGFHALLNGLVRRLCRNMRGVRCRPDGMSFRGRIASFQQSRCILAAFPDLRVCERRGDQANQRLATETIESKLNSHCGWASETAGSCASSEM